jgi:hypothetical protein
MSVAVEPQPVEVIRCEVERFVEAARKRSESDPDPRRRTTRRYHRSWPLAIWFNGLDFGAALHNASDQGLAFLSNCPIARDQVVFIKLFGYDDDCPYVPVVVRHSTRTEHGFLIGCEFQLADEALCREALLQNQQVPIY